MVDTQHFCLRWNNYQSSITSAFENLRDDEDFVDVTLACDGKSLKAHRVVLSACSPYFRELLKSTPCKHPVIVLQDVAWTDLHALVEFIYHGEVNVHQRSLSSFLKTAEVLRVSGLTQQHGDGREQLAQVQSLIRSQQQPPTPPVPNHHGSYGDKLVEDALFSSPSSPPHGATVNQLLRRAAAQQYRRRSISIDPDNEHKRARSEHIIGNNNNNELNLSHNPPQTQPADFSPSGLKNNALNLNVNAGIKSDVIEGNGISSTERENSPCSPSPTLQHSRCHSDSNENNVKNEPMELLVSTNQPDDNSNDSGEPTTNENGPSNLPHGPHSGGSSGGDHEDHDSPIGTYLTPSESKLFATAAGTFNFSMAALAADPAALGSLNQSLQGNDSLAGTSQGMEDFRCQPCNKSLSSLTRLKRHIQNVHMRPSREPVSLGARRPLPLPLGAPATHRCDLCGKLLSTKLTLKRHKEQQHLQPLNNAVCQLCRKVFRTLNSLNNHRSIYHRRPKGIAQEGVHVPALRQSAVLESVLEETYRGQTRRTAGGVSLRHLRAGLLLEELADDAHLHPEHPPLPSTVDAAPSVAKPIPPLDACLPPCCEQPCTPQRMPSPYTQQPTISEGNIPGTIRMPPPTSGGINEPQECPYCRRTFSCYYSLKRHFQDKHEQSDTLYVCEFCHRRYRTKNSLTTHKSLQHRGSSGMLKRLLKTTAIKSVLGVAANVSPPHGGQRMQ
ncbi:hypothetical protein GWI33_020835 [Rhynchophorus ferrugineus]|uniref:Broad-complex n=1 Tax=Rhynchophorus ferrugineus TaxID=354439 RepID=A0A834M048_RHYFE|nr:hypothetical protein GWI33_020835 [Rhynchophorus ferrugineus]